MSGDIPYIRAGSQKSIAHEDEEATAIKDISNEMESGGDLPRLPIQRSQRRQLLRKAGEEDGADLVEEPFPDIEPDEIPGEEVHSEEAGRPPDPPERESEEVPDAGDDREIEVEGEGAPVRKANGGTLKAEANSVAHLCAHRYRDPYREACFRAKMKRYRAERGAFKREMKS